MDLKIYRLAWLLAGLCSIAFPLNAQSDTGRLSKILDYYFGEAESDKPRFLAYPTLAYSPETKWELGLSSLYVFHAGRDTASRLSEVNAFAFVTQEQQKGLWLDHAIYGPQNAWFSLGRVRIMDYPLHYYGVGYSPAEQPLALVQGRTVSVRERWLKQIKTHRYVGLELDVQSFGNVHFDWEPHAHGFLPPLGHQGALNVGLGLGWVHDSRPNVLNARSGGLAELAFLHYNHRMGSEFPMNTLFFDVRKFWTLRPQQVLALHGAAQLSAGHIPFTQLSMIGGESIMRGHYLGRLRDKQMLALQAEWRWLPFSWSQRLGGALFASCGSVSEDWPFAVWHGSAGGGLRYLLFPEKDVYTRVDIGFHRAGYGLYFYIGEAF